MTDACYLRWRWAVLGVAVALLIWLPLEETQLGWVLLFACLASLLIVARVLLGLRSSKPLAFWLLSISGLVTGLLVTPLALLFMAFKGGLHGHGFPDFTPQQVASVLQAAPLWALAGLLLGGGFALIQQRFK